MKNNYNKIIILFSLCLLFACQGNKSPYYKEILKSEKGNLRGVLIGSSINDIKTLEKQKNLIDEMPNYLHYEYVLNMGNSYTITYDFSKADKLYEIELAIFLDEINDADLLFKNFSEHFNRKYGFGKEEDGGCIKWNTRAEVSNSKISLSMINDSQSYGFITIFVRDLDY